MLHRQSPAVAILAFLFAMLKAMSFHRVLEHHLYILVLIFKRKPISIIN